MKLPKKMPGFELRRVGGVPLGPNVKPAIVEPLRESTDKWSLTAASAVPFTALATNDLGYRAVLEDTHGLLVHADRASPRTADETRGLAAQACKSGVGIGELVRTVARAQQLAAQGRGYVLVLERLTPENLLAAMGAKGLVVVDPSQVESVARLGRPTICARAEDVNTFAPGHLVTLDGTLGRLATGRAALEQGHVSSALVRGVDQLRVRFGARVTAEASTVESITRARELGADGVRIDADALLWNERVLPALQRYLLATEAAPRRAALEQLTTQVARQAQALFAAADDATATVALGTHPPHQFFPTDAEGLAAVAEHADLPADVVQQRVEELGTGNSKLGLRGARWAVKDPDLFAAMARGLFEAQATLKEEGDEVGTLRLLIPSVGMEGELRQVRSRLERERASVEADFGEALDVEYGAGIDTARGAMNTHEISAQADFLDYGLFDLTESLYGISRDDSSSFLPGLVNSQIFAHDPFAHPDLEGAGKLVRVGQYLAGEAPKSFPASMTPNVLSHNALMVAEQGGIHELVVSPENVVAARVAHARFRAALDATAGMSPSRSGPRDQAEKMFAVLGDPRPLRGEGVVPHASIPEGLTAMEFVDGLLGQVESGELDGRELLMRVPADVVDQLGRPIVDPTAQAKPVATGIAASSGAGQGKIALSAEKATEYEKAGEPYVLIVNEVHHEEVESTRKSQGLISVRGGKTSHAAMIAANSDVPCVMNDKVTFNLEKRTVTIGRTTFKEGDALTIDGTKGNVYAGLVPLKSAAETDTLDRLLALADQHRRFHVLANADTPDEAVRAFKAGAEGIGLVRTENMFFEGGRVNVLREAVIGDPPRAAAAVAQLEKFQQHDFKALLEAANGKKVGIRLLDPPLFDPDDAKSVLPNDPKAIRDLAAHMGLQPDEVARRINGYQEVDPLIGLRGARLARLRPDLEAMQVRALAQAWVELNAEGKPPAPLNLMVPMIMNGAEMEAAAARIKATVKEVSDAAGVEVPLKLGSMIETPSAALDAGEIAKHVEWFSYGTNDLTQLTLGYGRNVAAKFIPELIAAGALDSDPGGTIDPGGVARLIKVAEFLGRDTVGELETGVCGAQGADPASIRTLESLGLDYVSVPPSQVARARVAAAQAAIARADAVADEPGEAPAASLGAAIDAAMAPITSFPVALDQRWLVDQLALSVRQAGAFLRSEASLSGDAAMVASQQPLVEKLLAAQHLLDTAHLANAMNAELNKLRRSGGQGSSFQTAAVALKAFCETATQGLGDETSTGREREVAQHAWDTLRAFEELRGELEKTSLPSDYDQQNRLRHKNDGWDNNHYTRQGPKQGESMAAYLRRISQEFLDDNGLQVKLLGAEKIPQGKKVIFAVTHRSGAIDRFVSNTALPLEEGKFMYMVRGDSPLDRIGQASGDPQNPVIAAGSFDETLAKVKAGFENGATTLVTYPEGTGTVSGEVRHVARSTAAFAEATGAVIVPVSIDDSFTAEPFQPGRIAVYVGNPIDPAEAKKLAGKEGGKGAVKLMQTNLHYQLAQGYHAGL